MCTEQWAAAFGAVLAHLGDLSTLLGAHQHLSARQAASTAPTESPASFARAEPNDVQRCARAHCFFASFKWICQKEEVSRNGNFYTLSMQGGCLYLLCPTFCAL